MRRCNDARRPAADDGNLTMSKWVQGTVVANRHWTGELFSLQVAAPEVTFVAGQFARLAMPAPPGAQEPMLGRPYSFVNSPDAAPHEFLIVTVPGGPLTPRLAVLQPGEPIWLLATANGFFTIDEVPAAATLWCLATGTGLAPYLSILRAAAPWPKFERVVLVHAVRHADELVYRDVVAAIAAAHPGALAYVPVVSREAHPDALPGRIPALVADGRLEARAGVPLTAANSQVMLCGNPAMVEDTIRVLAERGMRKHRRRAPGQITIEAYW
jgi:ferredoxin--NADP+ reductase